MNAFSYAVKRWFIAACAAALATALLPRWTTAELLRVRPGESLVALGQKLASDPKVTEVVFEGGTYAGSLRVDGRRDGESPWRPLLIRAADGASVVFDGSRPLNTFQPIAELPGVYGIDYAGQGGEAPKLWEPGVRIRYRLVADRQSVARFPATYTIESGRLLFHTSDGQPPAPGTVLISAHDCGMFINRPHVTVRGIAFQNYLLREKWSTGIDLRSDHIAVEECSSRNASLGFIINGSGNAVRRCTAEDVGGGIYVGGEDAIIENCRLYKQRDRFMVPMYAQDDTGIQFYHPARGWIARGNLCVGFGMGIFIKALRAPYNVTHNTLAGQGPGPGFGSTSWHAGQRFQYNIIADYDRPVEVYFEAAGAGDVDHNCYWSRTRRDLKAIGRHDLVADPKFVWPEWRDYRLANDSPCLKLASASGPSGAFPAIGNATIDLGPPRQWHVSESGRDGLEGVADRPVRTIQFAVDRAKPGDTIIVHPGLYSEPVRITRGGLKDRPIIIRAAQPGQAVLDAGRAAAEMIRIEEAPHVEIHDLELRWYGSAGIAIRRSPNVTVAGCRIWNAHWHGTWPTGTAVRVDQSPGFVGRQNVLFRQEHGFWLYHSPGSSLTHNTCIGNLYSAAAFLYSCEGSVCRNNSFAFQGNDVIVIEEELGQKHRLKSFNCDYNNYGTPLRRQPAGVVFDSITPRRGESYLGQDSKAIVQYNEYRGEMKRFVSMAEWREFSGLDRNTIIADPLYVNTANRDFSLDPASPNRRAGADGATIGAWPGDQAE